MALRAFTATFRCAIDVADEEDDDGEPMAEPTLEEIKAYLNDALVLDYDSEEYGNPVGMQSIEVNIDTLKELPKAEVKKLYGKG